MDRFSYTSSSHGNPSYEKKSSQRGSGAGRRQKKFHPIHEPQPEELAGHEKCRGSVGIFRTESMGSLRTGPRIGVGQ